MVEISRELNSFIPNYTQVFVEDDTENKQYIIYLKKEQEGNSFIRQRMSKFLLKEHTR